MTEPDLVLVYGDALTRYELSPDHPLKPSRYSLTVALLEELGWLSPPSVEVEEPRPATLSELLTVHSYQYVDAVQKAQAAARQGKTLPGLSVFGLDTPDVPVFPDIHDASALHTGASLQAMRVVVEGRAPHAYSPAGGMHHAMRARAAGFCVYNDCAVAIAAALDAGQKVAYLDFDAHHGDGVQAAFYEEPRVLTVSVHESGRFLFPGTGFTDEVGKGDGLGTCINIPLPPGSGDADLLLAYERVMAPAVRLFGPDLVVTQTGCDTHHSDPLADLSATLAFYPELAARLHNLVHEVCGGRWLILGGGGYDPADVTPRAWTAFLGTVLGHDVRQVALPPRWLAACRAAGGSPPVRLLDDTSPPTLQSTQRPLASAAVAEAERSGLGALRSHLAAR
jgi:acetoin utilization protein AcuC